MRNLLSFIAAMVLLALATAAQAQEPTLPAPLQNLRDEGAQMRYLGNRGGLDGWIAIKGGQEQYFYVAPGGEVFVMGLLFDKSGRAITVDQVMELQRESGGESLDLMAGEQPGLSALGEAQTEQAAPTSREFKTPSAQLYDDVEHSNWIALGSPEAPYIYAFIDPQCPHCHAFINDIRHDYIDNGLLQVRMIPVGFREDTRAQAAFLLAVPDPQKRWFAHLDGDTTALPVNPEINQQGVQRNLAIMQSWKINVTPFIAYQAKGGEVKIVQGRVQDLAKMMADLR